jgi:thiamine kinase-like enzyme
VTQFLGREQPIELLLSENGFVSKIGRLPGLHVPICGSVRTDGGSWVILQDVTPDLALWKCLTREPSDLQCEKLLLDRLAYLHAQWETGDGQQLLAASSAWLVSQERRLRWFEPLWKEWVGGRSAGIDETPYYRAAKAYAERAHGWVLAFLDRLSAADRDLWTRHMVDRDSLVSAARDLPVTLIHGDVVPRNVGLRRAGGEDTFVLIDWELAGVSAPALEVVHFLGHPLRDVTDHWELLDHYYSRYLRHHGTAYTPALWTRSCTIAIAHYGVTFLPIWTGMALQGGKAGGLALVDRAVERTRRALRELGG